MDNDPSQRTNVAARALEDMEAELDEASSKNIRSETFEQFRDHVLRTLERLPIDVIVRTIESTKDRIEAIILFKGYRTKY